MPASPLDLDGLDATVARVIAQSEALSRDAGALEVGLHAVVLATRGPAPESTSRPRPAPLSALERLLLCSLLATIALSIGLPSLTAAASRDARTDTKAVMMRLVPQARASAHTEHNPDAFFNVERVHRTDGWGQPVLLTFHHGIGAPALRSAGPDTEFWTADDITLEVQ